MLTTLLALCCMRCARSVRPELPPPRLRWPLSAAHVETPRPVLRWLDDEPTNRALDVHLCRDYAMREGCRTIEAPRGATALVVDAPLAPGRWFWSVNERRASVRDGDIRWQFTVRSPRVPHNRAWGARPDIDNDGFDDAVIVKLDGASERWVLFGARTTSALRLQRIEPPPGWRFSGFPTHGTTAMVQDVDGDGRAELAVSVERSSATSSTNTESACAVFHSGDDWASARAALFSVVEAGPLTNFQSAGDLDGDGFGDAVLTDAGDPARVRVCLGSRDGVAASRCIDVSLNHSGFVVPLAVGDTNDDGIDELLLARYGTGARLLRGQLRGARDERSIELHETGVFDPRRAQYVVGLVDVLGVGEPQIAWIDSASSQVIASDTFTSMTRAEWATNAPNWRALFVRTAPAEDPADQLMAVRVEGQFTVSALARDGAVRSVASVRDIAPAAMLDLDGDARPEWLGVASRTGDRCTLYVLDPATLAPRAAVPIEASSAGAMCFVLRSM